jgi:hypothetical protein
MLHSALSLLKGGVVHLISPWCPGPVLSSCVAETVGRGRGRQKEKPFPPPA